MSKFDDIRCQFPITSQCFTSPDGAERAIIYLDHGASTHPPKPVLDTYREFLEKYYANIHRGNHYLSQKASALFDAVSETILHFLGADPSTNEVVFTTNTTTALDLAGYLMSQKEGATLVSSMEHHSNDLPHRRHGQVHRVEILADGTLDYNDLESKLKHNRIKLVAITGASNVTGFMPDIYQIARLAHQHGAKILVDAAQLVAHHSINMRPDDHPEHIDFLAAAGHKAYAPFGAAFLVANRSAFDAATPYIPGGGTVKFVTDTDVVWADGMERHLSGTPNIAGVIALGEAITWLNNIGMDWVREHELEILQPIEQKLRAIPGVVVLGDIPAEKKLGVLPFTISGIHHDVVSTVLNNNYGIATRNGCFCAHPYLTRLLGCTDAEAVRQKVAAGQGVQLPGAVRATIGIFNSMEDLDKLIDAVAEIASEKERYAASINLESAACLEAMI